MRFIVFFFLSPFITSGGKQALLGYDLSYPEEKVSSRLDKVSFKKCSSPLSVSSSELGACIVKLDEMDLIPKVLAKAKGK